MSVATTGIPHEAASIAARGKPSRCDGRQKTSIAAYMCSTSSRWPVSTAPAALARVEDGIVERVGLGRIVGTDEQEAERRAEFRDRVDELRDALLGHEAGDDPDHHVGLVEPEVSSRRRSAIRDADGVEALEVDAVAEEPELPARRDAEPAHQLQILGVLHELDVAEPRGDRFERVHDRPLGGPVVGSRVEAVGGVHDSGYAGEPAQDPTVDPGLGVVGVEHVGSFRAEDLPQLTGGA